MLRGLIIEINEDYISVMTKGMEMKKIKHKEGCKIGEEIYFHREDYIAKNNIIYWKPMAVAAMLFLAISVGGIGYAMQNTVYSVVSLDINPSVQMELNRNDKVIGLEALNEDAEDIITEEMIGQDVEDVLKQLVAKSNELGYLESEGVLLISTVEKRNDNDDIDEFLVELIKTDDFKDFNVVLTEATVEELAEADDENVSVGIRKLERIRDNASETGKTNRSEVMSVRAFFDSIEKIDLLIEADENVKLNKERMKIAIEMHKAAKAAEKEENKEATGNSENSNKPENPRDSENAGNPDKSGNSKGKSNNYLHDDEEPEVDED